MLDTECASDQETFGGIRSSLGFATTTSVLIGFRGESIELAIGGLCFCESLESPLEHT
jgi:hypothetical protein